MQHPALTDTRRLQVVLQVLPIILIEWAMNGIVTCAHGRGLRLINTSPEHIRGRSVYELVQDTPDIQEYIHHALSGETFTAIVTFRERIFETYYRPCIETPYQPYHVLCIALDITEHIRLSEHVLNRFATSPCSHASVSNPEQSIEMDGAKIETMADTQCENFSPRQIEILRYAASGMKNAEIAQQIGIKPSTVKWYFEQIYQQHGAFFPGRNGRNQYYTGPNGPAGYSTWNWWGGNMGVLLLEKRWYLTTWGSDNPYHHNATVDCPC